MHHVCHIIWLLYVPVVPHPITEYATVQETLKYAEEATKEVNQKYVKTTYNLGVCMKAFPIIWNEPQKYKNHLIMKMIENKMQGTGKVRAFYICQEN